MLKAASSVIVTYLSVATIEGCDDATDIFEAVAGKYWGGARVAG